VSGFVRAGTRDLQDETKYRQRFLSTKPLVISTPNGGFRNLSVVTLQNVRMVYDVSVSVSVSVSVRSTDTE
jgi:hypothetical protein